MNLWHGEAAGSARDEREAWLEKLQFLSDSLELTAQPFAAGSPDGTLLIFNGAYCKLTGYSREELPGVNLIDTLTAPDSRERDRGVRKLLQDTRQPQRYEKNYVLKGGALLPVEVLSHIAVDARGNTLFFYSFVTDISDRKRTEEALLRSQTLLAAASRISHTGAWEWDMTTGRWTFTDEWLAIHGCKERTLSQGDLLEIAHPEDRARIAQAFEDVQRGLRPYSLVHRIIRQDTGEERIVKVSGELVRDARGVPVKMWGVARDVTEQTRTDEALRQSRAELEARVEERTRALNRLRELLEKSQEIANLGSWELDLVTGRLAWSDQVYRIFGLKPQEFGATYEAFLDIVHPADRAAVDEAYGGSIRRGKNSYEIEHRIVRKSDGQVRTVLEKCEHYRDSSGDVLRSVGMVQDITERKQAEEAREKLLKEVQDERSRLQAIVDSLPVGVWVADATGRIVLINDIARVIWGGKAPVSESIADYYEYKFWWADTGERALAEDMPLARAILHGETRKNIMIDIERFDGTRGTELISAAPVRDSGGKIAGGVVVIQDISDLRRAEEELKAAKTQAELYLDLLGHDISNMHQIILMQLEMALHLLDEEGKLDIGNRDLLDIPFKTLERSVSLLHNVRMLQKVRSGEYRAEPVDLGQVIGEIVSMYSDIPGRDVKIRYSPVSGYRVMASPLIKDVIGNLVDNAVKHSEDPVSIGIGIARVERKGIAYYRVSVEDNGSGIPDEQKELVFHRFKRGETAAKGTGLGLYLVKTLVESFDGQVEVEDRIPGDHKKGARFNVYLPVANT